MNSLILNERGNNYKIVSFLFLFSIICLSYSIISIVTNNFIVTDDIFVKSYSDKVSSSSIEDLLEMRSSFSWVGYAIIPITSFLKIIFVCICLSVGFILADLENFEFKPIINSTLKAEFVFVIYQSVYTINMGINVESLTLENSQYFFPFSVLSFFQNSELVFIEQYILKTLNLFEIFYIILIAYLISKDLKISFLKSIKVSSLSYTIGLFFWIIFLSFITLQLA